MMRKVVEQLHAIEVAETLQPATPAAEAPDGFDRNGWRDTDRDSS